MGGALGRTAPGTIAAPLAGRMARSGGRISVRCLNRPLAPTQCQRLEALRQEVSERRARGLLDLIGAADDGWVGARRESRRADGRVGVEAPAYRLLDDVARGGKRRRLPAVAFLRMASS